MKIIEDPSPTANTKTHSWEVPQIDLNIRHYNGSPSDAIRSIENSIVKYVNTPQCTLQQKQIYSAIYNALSYYKSLYHLPSIDYQEASKTNRSCKALKKLNNDTKMLRSKYNSKDPSVPIVVTTSARIKSLDSAMNKFKSKIDEYIVENRDFRYFNESIRDLLGIKFIINPPAEIKAKGKEAETDYLYQFCYDYLRLQGLEHKTSKTAPITILPVNTRHNPKKLETIKSNTHYLPGVIDGPNPIYIPKSRPEFIEKPEVDQVLKDRVAFPKPNGYQKEHICTFIKDPLSQPSPLPNNIISSAAEEGFTIECQICLKEHEDRSLFDPNVNHSLGYKKGENDSYHRLAIPFYIESNPAQTKPLTPLNIADSFEKFYGHSFEAHFGIPFETFSNNFTVEQRNKILSGLSQVEFNPTTRSYTLTASKKYFAIAKNDIINLVDTLNIPDDLKPTVIEELIKKINPHSELLTLTNSSDDKKDQTIQQTKTKTNDSSSQEHDFGE